MKRDRIRPLTASILAGALLPLGGCAAYFAKDADRAAYGIIQRQGAEVKGMDPAFTIESAGKASLNGYPTVAAAAEFLGPDGATEAGAYRLNLNDSLSLAVRFSRQYQSRKEQLYLGALSLALTRHQFAPSFSGSGSGSYAVVNQQKIVNEVDAVTGLPVPTLQFDDDRRINGSGDFSAGWLIRDVGRITTALSTDFTRFITGDPSLTSVSALSVTFLRPLIRDSGYRAQEETLVQAQRQMLYDLRDFTQFRKDFTVSIARAYYLVLGSRDAVRTSYLNLKSSQTALARTQAMADEGKTSQADLGRSKQQALSAENSWLNAVRSYRQQLDNFKITIGLGVDANIVLDDRELASLGIGDVDIGLEEALQAALISRLDYLTAKDRLADAERKSLIAALALWPKLDLTATASMSSAGTDGFSYPDPERYRWNAGLALDPGLDKTQERNTYRSSIITRNSTARAVEQQEDTIKLAVREDWRSLEQARRSYLISEQGVQLAERRVEEQNLRAELGTGRAQDLIDAQNALVDAQNSRSQNLVNHMVARLTFWRDLGLLIIGPDGKWGDMRKPDNP